nr:maleylpyruvate isomerase N-terminal domain-containing protein [uncultured Actinoplanes sp.]
MSDIEATSKYARALRAAAPRAAAVIRAAGASGAPVPGLTWTVGETAAHLVNEFRDYAAYAQGSRKAAEGDRPSRLNAAANAAQLRADPDRELAGLADRLLPAVEGFLTVEPPAGRVTVSNGIAMSWETMSSALLGELLVHGRDIARAGGQPWRIDRADALLVIEGVMTMVPQYLDERANLHASFELRLRGGPRYLVEVDGRKATAGLLPSTPARADCWISADPEAFLLVGFGRVGQWGQIARGRLVAGGRKPWLATRFASLITGP